ncbi:MAG: 30S ribosomal protein S14 [Pseudomonadota bacterium]|nr:30S ribosomal protein S14 [Pseudomonadota bacterium]
MAKTSVIHREGRRLRTVKRFAARRAQLFAQANDKSLGVEERRAAQTKIQKMPRDASPVRLHNRCRLTGRPHGFYRKFGLSRSMLRIAAMNGDVPGLVKASW